MKPQSKPQEKATFSSSFQFFSKAASRKPFCLNFSLCRSDDVNNVDLFEPERKKSTHDTIIARHYSTLVNKPGNLIESSEKLKESKLEPIKENRKNLKKELFLLKNNQRLIIAKIVVKTFSLKKRKFDKMTKISYEIPAKTGIVQQEIVKNLARKFRKNSMNLIVNLSPGDNVSLSAFLKEDLFSIGIDSQFSELLRIKKVHGFNKNIELLQAKFHDLPHLSADALFINFFHHKDFSLLKDLRRENLENWLRNIESLAILIPKHCDISELAIVFHDFFELNKREEDPRSILVEVLKQNEELEGYLIFYGPVTTITRSQELEFLESYLSQDLTEDFLSRHSQAISFMVKKLGVKTICKLLNYCEETRSISHEPLLEKFLHYARNFNFLQEAGGLIGKIDDMEKEFPKKMEISLDFNEENSNEAQKLAKKLIISNEMATNFSDCDNKESIVGSLVPGSYLDRIGLGEKGANSSYSQNNSLGMWNKGSEYEGSWSEKD